MPRLPTEDDVFSVTVVSRTRENVRRIRQLRLREDAGDLTEEEKRELARLREDVYTKSSMNHMGVALFASMCFAWSAATESGLGLTAAENLVGGVAWVAVSVVLVERLFRV